jgi:hypothetical protein
MGMIETDKGGLHPLFQLSGRTAPLSLILAAANRSYFTIEADFGQN